jgi:hypothetical protein
MVIDEAEVAYAIIEPHYDAIRDIYLEHELPGGERLRQLEKTRLLVDPSVRNSERHYAACRDDGLLIVIAPQAAELAMESLVALLCHEFGHAVDFLYPGRWACLRGTPAVWLPETTKRMSRIRRQWADRTDDQVEWDADAIAYAVTGRPIQYCGACLLQCFSGGVVRPAGLR